MTDLDSVDLDEMKLDFDDRLKYYNSHLIDQPLLAISTNVKYTKGTNINLKVANTGVKKFLNHVKAANLKLTQTVDDGNEDIPLNDYKKKEDSSPDTGSIIQTTNKNIQTTNKTTQFDHISNQASRTVQVCHSNQVAAITPSNMPAALRRLDHGAGQSAIDAVDVRRSSTSTICVKQPRKSRHWLASRRPWLDVWMPTPCRCLTLAIEACW